MTPLSKYAFAFGATWVWFLSLVLLENCLKPLPASSFSGWRREAKARGLAWFVKLRKLCVGTVREAERGCRRILEHV